MAFGKMFDGMKDKFDEYKEKAKDAAEQVTQKVNEKIHPTEKPSGKPEEKKTLVNEKPQAETGTSQNPAEETISKSAITRGAEMMLKKSIEQAEKLMDKFIKPYDPCKVTTPEHIASLAEEIERKAAAAKKPDTYYEDLLILYLNSAKYSDARRCFDALNDSTLRQRYETVFKACFTTDDRDFLTLCEFNKKHFMELKIFAVLYRYAKLLPEKQNYAAAQELLEACASLDPLHASVQRDLLTVYRNTGNTTAESVQTEILRLL